MINSIKIDKIKGSSKLYIDYIYNFEKLKGYYAADYKAIAKGMLLAVDENEKGTMAKAVEILIEQNKERLNLPGMREKAQLLKKRGAQVVITGQQLGLLGGPLYTIYKALTAVKLADLLSSKLNKPVVPVFWLEGEDHDLNEANTVCLLDLKNRPYKLGLKGLPKGNRLPVGELLIGEGVGDLLQKIEQITPESEFKPALIELIKESYIPTASWKNAFSYLILQLLGNYGLLLVDASDKRWKELARPIFEKAIIYIKDMRRILHENNERLMKDGYHLQVTYNPNSTNLFLKMEEAKYLIEAGGEDSFHLKGGRGIFSQHELLKLAKEKPERFVPNVLLRPLVQDYLLPTLAYVAGPAEIAYFAQIKPLYKFFGVKMPFIFPRSSITLIEKKIDKVIRKFNIDLVEFFNNPERIIEKNVDKELARPIEEPFAQAERKLDSIIQQLRKIIISIDTTLTIPLEKASAKMRYQLYSLRKKTVEAGKRANQTKVNHMEKLKNNLLPLENLQERCLNIFQFLIRYGPSLIDKIYDEIDLNNFGHKFIYL